MPPFEMFRLGDSASAPVLDATDSGYVGGDAIVLQADAGDDLFFEPGTNNRKQQLRVLGAWTTLESLQFAARVQAEFHTDFDSGILLGWFAPDRWFKICAELDPQGRARVVSVVTRGRSDDSNGTFLTTDRTHLRIARIGRAIALHSSNDREQWDLVRYFELGEPSEAIFLGLAAQSPLGTGTRAIFDEISLIDQVLMNPRDGS